ncbi:MAG: GyrI-like domain-containing protein [Methanomassiliicoccaceae archaeon]|nr:GyrI-like domain-containing protein [Methanomassiliicoccaceae archaeon]
MPRVTDINIFEKKEQDTLVIRTRAKVTELSKLVGEAYTKIFSYIAELNEFPEDAPFITYHNTDMNDLDVEFGVPVNRPLPSRGDVKAGKIKEGKEVSCVFRGSYSDTESTYGEMAAFAAKNGFKLSGTAREYYFNGPAEVPESELLTKIAMPIE